jgi:hypothetical protein
VRLRLVICAALAPLSLPLLAAPDAAAPRARAEAPVETSGEAPPTPELERAARDYRISVYRAFRLDRAEFNRRNAVWQELYAKWKAAGQPAGDAALLVAWLRDAIAANNVPTPGSLPLPPEFGLARDKAQPRLPQPPSATPPSVELPTPRLARNLPPDITPGRRADAASLPDVALPIDPAVGQRPQSVTPPDADDPSVASDPPRRAAPPTSIEADPPELPAESRVDVNEIAVRVSGHNLAVATLAEEIARSENPTPERLATFVERLEGHAVRFADLSPYYALVEQADRDRLRPLSGIDEARDLLAKRIASAIAATEADASLPATNRAESLARLAELSRRLRAISTAAP